MTRLVLISMIKNEEKIIERCFKNILPIIDAICVTDTGSTDNTVSIVNNFFDDKKIPGKVYLDTFKNFGYNRTNSFLNAVDYCKELEWDLNDTYGILIDADMEVVIKNFDKSKLNNNGYKIIQETPHLEYYNLRFVKMSVKWRCVGVTHEYWDGSHSENLGKDLIYINDVGDGGCKSDKLPRDARLLEEGINEEPNNVRYHFYLAQTYKDMGQFKKAIEFYKKRIKMGGWYEEIWYSYYMISRCYFLLNDFEKFEAWAIKAYKNRRERSEPIYHLVKYFRENSQHFKAWHYLLLGKSIGFPSNDLLFMEKEVYSYLFDYEETILHYYIYPNERLNGLKTSIKYLNKYDNYENCVFGNIEHYMRRLLNDGEYVPINFDTNFGDYTPSSISLIEYDNKILANVRLVNYRIQSNGSYLMCKDSKFDPNEKVLTKNAYLYYNHKLEPISDLTFMDGELEDLKSKDCRIMGLEDVRLYKKNNKIMYSATNSNYSYNDCIRIVNGEYNNQLNKFINNSCLHPPTETYCEKNWIGIEDKFIYKWHPLQVGIVIDNKLEILTTHDTPSFFKHYRGSSNIVDYNNNYWVITHGIKNTTPRKYFHQMVVLNKEFKVLKYSVPFYFDKWAIEYCLGLYIKNETLIMTVSRNDSNPIFAKVKIEDFDKYFM